jgi:casein kinase 1
MNYVRKLGFEESPDYDFLRSLFAKVLDARGETDDGQFDWMALNGGRGWEVGNTPSAHLAQAHAQAQTPHRARRHRTDRERERDREARREREREKERERLANDSNASPSTPGGGLALPSPAVKKPNRHDRLAIGENTPTGGASVNPIAPMSRRASGLDTSPRSNLALNGTIGVDRLNVNTTHPYASAPHSGTGADGRPLSTLQNATSGSNNNNKPLPSPFPTTNGNGTATGSGSPERSEGRQYRAVEGMRIENDGSRRSRGLGGDDDRHLRKKNAFAMCCR